MPQPTPSPGQEQDEFISECVSHPTMKKEYPDIEQRLGVCYTIWRNK